MIKLTLLCSQSKKSMPKVTSIYLLSFFTIFFFNCYCEEIQEQSHKPPRAKNKKENKLTDLQIAKKDISTEASQLITEKDITSIQPILNDSKPQAPSSQHIILENPQSHSKILNSMDSKHPTGNKVENTTWIKINNASFRCLDKITGQVKNFKLKVGEELHFKTFRVILHFAAKSKKFAPIDIAVFLEVFEENKNGEWSRYFSGWMFASHPNAAALVHPIYDIWPIDNRLPY